MAETEHPKPFKPSGDMLTANLLAMLKGWSAYGYDLVQRLEDEGFGAYNKGTVYRALRHMESSGLVSSMWDTSQGGPARRMYTLTRAGILFLDNWIAILDVHRNMLERLTELAVQSADPWAARETDRADSADDSQEST
jgi:PadR family transcriptional regulator, regulatory protein PadR